MSSGKIDVDCKFYYTTGCGKKNSCPFRHEPAALRSYTTCSYWKENKCRKLNCEFRHSIVKKAETPCYWENKPCGCQKVDCPYVHLKNRSSAKEGQAKNRDVEKKCAAPNSHITAQRSITTTKPRASVEASSGSKLPPCEGACAVHFEEQKQEVLDRTDTALRAIEEYFIGMCSKLEDESSLCSLCSQRIHVPVTLNCLHTFCKECISDWMKYTNTCPKCNENIKTITKAQNLFFE